VREKPELGSERVHPGYVGALSPIELSGPHESQLIVRLPTNTGLPQKYGILLHDGALAPVEAWMSAGLLELLDTPGYVWSSQAEALPHLGRGGAMPSTLVLSGDGRSIIERVSMRAGGFATAQDRRGEGVGAVGPGVGTAPALAGVSPPEPDAGDGPEARTDYEAVYSRALGQLFVVGGLDPVTHQDSGTIWSRKVDVGVSWAQVPSSGYAPARVLAATFSYRDGKLWVLDEVKHGSLKRARLVRLDPATGEFEQIGLWPRLGLYNQHWLVLDKGGEVLLVASTDVLRNHVVVRFDNHGANFSLDRVVFGQGALAFKPMVDEGGYSFIINKKPDGSYHNTETLRRASLGGVPAKWAHLGSCW
jgi:hypothetical protein